MAIACVTLDTVITHFGALGDDRIGSARIHRLVYTDDPEELAILGSSRAYANYDAGAVDPHAFNYGIKGAGFDAVAFQIKKALERSSSRPVIVNTDFGWWSMYGIGDVAAYVPSVEDADVRRLLGDHLKLYHRIPLARYFGLYQNYVSDRLSEVGREHENTRFSAEHFVTTLQAMGGWGIRHDPDSTRLARLFDLVDRHPDRRLIFVVAPYHPAYFDVAEYSDSSEAWLRTLSRRPNVTVFDFSRRVYADSLWADPVHMNQPGARRFSQDLRAEIGHLLSAEG